MVLVKPSDFESPKHSQTRGKSDMGPKADATEDKGAQVGKVKGNTLTEGDKDLVKQPDNNLFIVMPILWLLVFLASLDQTIVGTILPTISAHLHGTPTQYQWVGTSYLLGMGATTPIWGRLTDVIGRKPVLQSATLIFLCFSAMCGAAPNMRVLIAGRALQGVGAGALLSGTMMVVADIVPLAKRPLYLGLVTCSFTVSSVVGPLIGGAFADRVTWRWAFYFNLPTAGAAFVLLFFFLKLNRIQRLTFRGFLQTFDFLGLFMLMAAAGLVVVGFSLAAENGFSHPEVYVCIILGGLFLIATIVNCLFTKRTAIFPARAFRIRTVPLWLCSCLFGSVGFFPTTYLLPQFFQGLLGDSPIAAGIKMIPFIVLTSINVVTVGILLSKKDKLLKPIGIAGNGLAAIGFGLMYKYFRYGQPLATYEGLQVLAGMGIGMTMQPQMIGMQAAMPLKEVGTMTTAMLIVRPAGAAVGLAMQESLFSSRLHSKFSKIQGYGTTLTAPQSGSQAGYAALHDLPDPLRAEALTAFADALADCWLVDCVMFIAAFVAVLFVKEYSLKRTAGGAPTTDPPKADGESTPKDGDQAEKAADPVDPTAQTAAKDSSV